MHYPKDNIIQIQNLLNLLMKFALELDQSDEKTQMKTFLLVKTFKLISNLLTFVMQLTSLEQLR